MDITKSKEYIECLEYVESFSLMMKLSGFQVDRENKYTITNSLERMIDRTTVPNNLEFEEEFSISADYNETGFFLGVTFRTDNTKTLKALCDIIFYIDQKLNTFKVRFKLYNDILQNNHDFQNLYLETFHDIKVLIERIVPVFEVAK